MLACRPLAALLPVALLLGVLAAPSALPDDAVGEQAKPSGEAFLVSGSRDFACELARRLATKPENFFFSPYSISSALGMARAGAAGATAKQMDAVLHLPPDATASARALGNDLAAIREMEQYGKDGPTKVPAYVLSVANGLFSQQGWTFLEGFRRSVAKDFHAEFHELDFARGEEARKAINGWVEDNTQHRIKDIVPPGLPTADTRLVLANAIYFKGAWANEFSVESTVDGPFTVAAGKDVTARRMKRHAHLSYAETPAAQWLELPYRGDEISMVVILPRAKDGVDAIVAGLEGEELGRALTSLRRRLVALELPKFSFTSQVELVRTLTALGMTDAFGPQAADFTRITAEKPLYIGAVLHKAFVAVDEQGTEAAAATVVMAPTGAARPRPECRLNGPAGSSTRSAA